MLLHFFLRNKKKGAKWYQFEVNKLFYSKMLWLQKSRVGVLHSVMELLCMLRDLAASSLGKEQ